MATTVFNKPLDNEIASLNEHFNMVNLGILSDMTSLINAISTLESTVATSSTYFVKFNTNTLTEYWLQWEYHTGIVQKDDDLNWTAIFTGTSGETIDIGSTGQYYSSRQEKSHIINFYGFTLGQAKAITAKPYNRNGIAFGIWVNTLDSQKIIPFYVSIPANATTLTISEVMLYDMGKVTSGSYDVRIMTWRAS